jgi:hypothetical protein
MATQNYSAQINLTVPDREDLVVIYHDTTGPVGMSADQIRADAERAALAQVPGGRVVGSRVETDGIAR